MGYLSADVKESGVGKGCERTTPSLRIRGWMTRRGFLNLAAGATAGWLVGCRPPTAATADMDSRVERSSDPEAVLKEFGLEGLIPLYRGQRGYVERFGCAPYPALFDEIEQIAEGTASDSIKEAYFGNWGELASPEGRVEAASEKARTVELRGFSDEGQMRQVLDAVAKLYPTLLIAAPPVLVKASVDEVASDKFRAFRDRVFIPEPLLSAGDERRIVEKLGVVIHEFSHYFGGRSLNGGVVRRKKLFVTLRDLVAFVDKASESSEALLKTYAGLHADREIGVSYGKLEKVGPASLTDRERSAIEVFLQRDHNNTFGAEGDLLLEEPVNRDDPYYDVKNARRAVVGALFKMITPDGGFTEADFNPAQRLCEKLSGGK